MKQSISIAWISDKVRAKRIWRFLVVDALAHGGIGRFGLGIDAGEQGRQRQAGAQRLGDIDLRLAWVHSG